MSWYHFAIIGAIWVLMMLLIIVWFIGATSEKDEKMFD